MPLETLYLWTHLLVPGHHFLPSSHSTSLLFFTPSASNRANLPLCVEQLPLPYHPPINHKISSNLNDSMILQFYIALLSVATEG